MMNNDTPADAIKPCRYCGGQKRFQIVSPVSDHAWADCFCVKDRTTSLAAQEPEAMRYDFDGFGYQYIDSGSGSDWQTRYPDAEALYAAPSLAAQDGLVEALGKMWGTLTYIRAASDCDASRNAADEVMREVEPALSAIKGDKS